MYPQPIGKQAKQPIKMAKDYCSTRSNGDKKMEEKDQEAPPISNNQHIIDLQDLPTTKTTSEEEDQNAAVQLTFYGHAAFMLTSPMGVKLMFDPWKNDDSGYWGMWYHRIFPITKCDVALSTHDHFDHNALERIDAPMKLDRMCGTFKLGDVTVEGIADKHSVKGSTGVLFAELGVPTMPPNNTPLLDNVVFVVTTGHLRFLFWGDNRADPPARFWEKVGHVDVLVIPIDDSQHLLTDKQVNFIAHRCGAGAIVPCHYLTNGVGSTLSTLKDAQGWVDEHRETTVMVGTHTQTFRCSEVCKWRSESCGSAEEGEANAADRLKTVYFGHHLPFDPLNLDRSELGAKAVTGYCAAPRKSCC